MSDVDAGHVSPATMREVCGEFATGVTVITTGGPDEPYGCVANAVTSVSLDPPLMLICLAHTASTHQRLTDHGAFVINVLPDTQVGRGICGTFASKAADKFAEVDHEQGRTGSPVLADSIGWLECTVEHAYELGDHTAFVGRVVAAERSSGDPLLFFRGQLRRMRPAPRVTKTAARAAQPGTEDLDLVGELSSELFFESLAAR